MFMFFTVCVALHAATNETLRGKVIDKKTGEALIGATLRIVENNVSTVSDIDGLFKFKIWLAENTRL